MDLKGDSNQQAVLRDRLTKRSNKVEDGYLTEVLSAVRNKESLLDIGCGTGHIIGQLAMREKDKTYVGLDISDPMIQIADKTTKGLSNVSLLLADCFDLPLRDSSFDVVTSRLADYSLPEVRRVLRKGGRFFEYGLGPKADREIAEFFPGRIERSNFFFPENPDSWIDEVSMRVEEAGFEIARVREYETSNYYRNAERVADLIDMVPLVRDFDRERDRDVLRELARKYGGDKGIAITWHYYILEALRC